MCAMRPRSICLSMLGLVAGLLAIGPAWAPPAPPRNALQVDVAAQKQIFSRREGVMLRVQFKALQPVRLCMEKDPLTQFRFRVYRSGQGELALAPLVSRDTRVMFGQRLAVHNLASGEVFAYRVNLKRLQFLDGNSWESGDYAVNAAFLLCPQAEGLPETTLPATSAARFMIMN